MIDMRASISPPAGASAPLVSVVAPVYNESATLAEFLGRVVAACNALSDRYRFEFVVVDDGSTDRTLAIATDWQRMEPRLRVIELRRNFGQTAALQAALGAARGDIMISMDSDLQHFPEEIPAFLAKLDEGYDLVCGWRYERQEGPLRRWPSGVANWMVRRLAGVAVHDVGTTYRAYRRDLVTHLHLLGEQHRLVPALAQQIGARVTEIPIRNIERPAGKSNYGIGRTVSVLLDIFFVYYSSRYFNKPLKAFGKLALLLFAAASAIAVLLIAYTYRTGLSAVRDHGGWFLLCALLVLSSMQLMLTGFLAEVLVRTYHRIGSSDGYVVRREWDPRT